ncbi:MAG: pantoate kinase [Promethearchaeota archaeon]
MINDASYWVASHLTGIFEIKDSSKNLLQQGSRGAGLSINRGVITTVRKSDYPNVEILYDGVRKTAPEAAVTKRVIDILLSKKSQKNLSISHNFEVPLSSGFGASAAGAIGTAFALNEFLDLGMSRLELFQVAHKAEVLTKSGLGDVIGIYQGGLEIRLKEGAPGIGKTMSFTNSNKWKIATIHLGTLSTSEVLSDPHKRKAINEAGNELISELILQPTFSNFARLSAIFSNRVSLWSPQLEKYVKDLPNTVLGAQIMLGEAFFIFYKSNSDLKYIKIPVTQICEEAICQKTIVRCR